MNTQIPLYTWEEALNEYAPSLTTSLRSANTVRADRDRITQLIKMVAMLLYSVAPSYPQATPRLFRSRMRLSRGNGRDPCYSPGTETVSLRLYWCGNEQARDSGRRESKWLPDMRTPETMRILDFSR